MLRSLVVAALLGVSSVAAIKCTRSSHCPEDSPCCSTYGECGVGAYCLGGCDPTMSFSLNSCVPAPVCEDRKMKMDNLDRVVDIGKYLGDSSKADWVAQGEPVVFKDNVLLTMPKDSVGTLMSSTVYMWYGNVKARFKTSRGPGVITAFILFSDVKDEIDYEFVGTELGDAQTNYYFQGITNYENSENITLSDTFANFHDYEIRWTPDRIEWWIDGKMGRSLDKKDTWNATAKNFNFPQTPSRVQLSLWPGGKEGNAEGTVAWAGGPIDWDHPDIQKSGYFYAAFSDVEIQCFNAKSGPGSNSGTSYWYTDARGTNDTITDGDKRHTIASLMASGEDMDKGKKTDEKKKDKDKDDDKDDKDSKDDKDKDKDDDEDDEPATIPGGSSGAPTNDHNDDDGGNSGSGSGSGSGSSSAPQGNPDGTDDTEPADTTNCETNSFNQDCAKSDSSKSSSEDSGKGSSAGSRNGASALAIIIAGGALFWL